MGAMLIQEDEPVEARNAEAQERLVKSVNLKSPWKECAYGQFTLSRDQWCHNCKSRGIFL